jgi:hypothetical protein
MKYYKVTYGKSDKLWDIYKVKDDHSKYEHMISNLGKNIAGTGIWKATNVNIWKSDNYKTVTEITREEMMSEWW